MTNKQSEKLHTTADLTARHSIVGGTSICQHSHLFASPCVGTSHLKKGNLASARGTRQRYALRIPQLAPHAENSDKTLGLVFPVRRREFKGAGVVFWERVSASGRCESCCSLRICPLWMESNWKAWARGGVVHEVCTQPSQSEGNRTEPLKSPTRKPHPLGSGASLPE